MRLPILRGRVQAVCAVWRRLLTDGARPSPKLEITGDPELLEFAESWPVDEQKELRERMTRDMAVLGGFLGEGEEAAMLAELEPKLKRMRYEYDHWDNAIHGYRETERREWSPAGNEALARVAALAFPNGGALPYAHVLDLAPGGHIKPHVDAVRFCGEVIAGLCLGSAAVMRLKHEQHPHLALDALLPRRALYIMRGVARYEFNHAVLGNEESWFRGRRVVKTRRVAVILRSQPDKDKE